jgi:competence protein ComEC
VSVGGGARAEIDARLAIGAAVAWIAVLLGLGHSAVTVVAVAGALLALGCGALVLRIGIAGRSRIGQVLAAGSSAVALAAFCAALVLLPLVGRLVRAGWSPLTALARRQALVDVVVRVGEDPRVVPGRGLSGGARVAVAGSAVSIAPVGAMPARPARVSGAIEVLGSAQGWPGLVPGQAMRVRGTLLPPADGGLSVVLLARGPPTLLGRPPWWQREAQSVRVALRQSCRELPADLAGLLPGLIDGDTSGLSPVVAEQFRVAGLSHLVAVSGTNCSIVLGCVVLGLRRCRTRRRLTVSAAGIALAAFVVIARPTPSVLRAAVMAGVGLGALAGGRPRQALPSLAACVLALLVWNPLLAGNASFAMSALATAALIVLAPAWADGLRRRRVPAVLAAPIAVAAAAHLVTAPIAAGLSGRLSVVAVPANVLAEPVVAIVTVLGFAAAAFAAWLPLPAQLLIWTAGWPCRWLLGVARFFGTAPGAAVPWPRGAGGALLLAAAGALLVAGLHRPGLRAPIVGAGLVAALIQLPVRTITSAWPPGGTVLVACDVGQGDGLFVPLGGGRAIVVDTGPEPLAIDRCLRQFGIAEIPLLVLTHFHDDHIGGITGALHGRRVDRVLTSPLAEPIAGYRTVTAAFADSATQVAVARPGDHFSSGPALVDVLGPARAYHGTRSDPNNSSVVLRITVRGVRILMTGDAEVDAQAAMLAAGVDLRADVLKVPHHGSAYFDPSFLAAVGARVAVISVGAHNDYGHPAPSLLSELSHLRLSPARTDTGGDIAVAGAAAALHVLAHGTAVGVAAPAPRCTAPCGRPSGADARMAAWQPAVQASTPFRSDSLRLSCSSATRSCSSVGQSARSPPPREARTPTSWRQSEPPPRSTARNCMNSSGPRCSATPAC